MTLEKINNSYQSSKMKDVQSKYGKPLPEVLVELQNTLGTEETCRILEISRATLGYWNLKCGVIVARIAYMPRKEEIVVKGANGSTKTIVESD